MKYLSSLIVCLSPFAFAQDVNEKNESAMKAASAKVAPCIVKIETAGGTETLGVTPPPGPGPRPPAGPGIRKGVGPTTGLVVASDGYIITSSFNFANKPSDIFVTIPNRPGRLVAKQVATDTTRMLTLIKVDAKDLPLPQVMPKNEIVVGQWSLALGRTLMPDPRVAIEGQAHQRVGREYGEQQTIAPFGPVQNAPRDPGQQQRRGDADQHP